MKNKIKNFIAALAVAGGIHSATPAIADDAKVDVGASTTIATDYVTRAGFIVGEGPVNQTIVSGSYGNFSAFVWENYDLKNKELKEVEVGLTYGQKVNKNISARLSVQNWKYPSAGHDNVLELGLHYSGAIEADITLTHLLTGKGGNMTHATLAKPIKMKKFALTPIVETTYLDDFFGVSGISKYSAGASVSKQIGDFNVEAFCMKQFGKQGLENKAYGGISIGKKL